MVARLISTVVRSPREAFADSRCELGDLYIGGYIASGQKMSMACCSFV